MLRKNREEIDDAKVEALCDVLKTALPELVTIAFTQFKAELHRIVPELSDDEWETLKNTEDGRRRKAMGELIWIKKPALLHPPGHWWDPDCARYEAEIGDGKPPYCIRVRTTKGKTFFIVGAQHYTVLRSFEKAKAFAQANYDERDKRERSIPTRSRRMASCCCEALRKSGLGYCVTVER
jgi:hypothetical protein